MKSSLATTCLLAGTLLAGGCATKKYVRNTTTPIQAKVDQVGEQTATNSRQIEDTRNQVKQVDENATNGISAANERASSADQRAATADQHASDAMNHADAANRLGEQNSQSVAALRGVIANIDDYKLQASVAVPFAFDKYALTGESKEDLDKIAAEAKTGKRYFIAVEGYTDSTGSRAYNEALSQKRADAVVHYLVAAHEIPIYRIHRIGLGMDKPVDEAKNRAARAKNRRVEVKVYSADQVTAGLDTGSATATSRDHQ